jgi:hypothetical protein
MHYHVTVTIKQLATLRLMLRLQKVRAIRTGLQKFRAGSVHEAVALSEILQKEDLIAAVDIGLMMIEHETFARQVAHRDPDPSEPVNLALEDLHLEYCRKAASTYYSADGTLGSQAEQGLVLQAIADEAEGLRLALSTASPHEDHLPIIQNQPRGLQ